MFQATIQHNNIYGNAYGISRYDGTIQNNRIYKNGFGLDECEGLIQNNLIYHNYAGGISYCRGTIQFNTIVGNINLYGLYPQKDWGNYGGGLQACTGVRNCIVWGNIGGPFGGSQVGLDTTPSYCCIQDWHRGGEGNTGEDPRFVDPDSPEFELLPFSPCIDAATTVAGATADFNGDPRGPSGFDMGAQEFLPPPPGNSPPNRPNNLSPLDEASDISLSPTLSASVFEDPDTGDTLAASHWQIDDASDFSSPELEVFKNGRSLTSLLASEGRLGLGGVYYWRVSYMDSGLDWSNWSLPSSFTIRTGTESVVPTDFPNIQAAIDAAGNGQVILVRAGTYFEHIQFGGKNLALKSLDPLDPDIVKATSIDGGGETGSVVTFAGSETEEAILDGLTITGGNADPWGGGINGHGCQATIRRNRIRENMSVLGGGLFDLSGALIEDNTIERNTGSCLWECSGRITGNRIAYNLDGYAGGGLSDCSGLFENNLIYGNEVICLLDDCFEHPGSGGAMYHCSGDFFNNVFYDNHSTLHGGAMALCDGRLVNCTIVYNNNGGSGVGTAVSTFRGTIQNCIFAFNGGDIDAVSTDSDQPRYCLFTTWLGGGEGNFSADPRFVGDGPFNLQLAPDSPCIDAGASFNLSSDLEGNPRPYDAVSMPRGDGSNIDLGAYEYIGSATPDPIPNRPANLTPVNDATSVSVYPTLTSSTFSDPNSTDEITASEWQVADDAAFSGLVVDETFDYSLSQNYDLIEGSPTLHLASWLSVTRGTTYWWRLRQRDAYNGWSEWSEPTHFTTRPLGPLFVPSDYPTIQAAINEAIEGDQVVLSPGTYMEAVNFGGKNIVLRSENPDDPETVESTIIKDNPIVFQGTEKASCSLIGLTITNTNGRGVEGAGSAANVMNCRIVGCKGDGIYTRRHKCLRMIPL
jgi:hypothetical protein